MVFNSSPYMAALMAHLLGGGGGNYGLPFNSHNNPIVFAPPVQGDNFGMPIFHAAPPVLPVNYPHPLHPFHYRR